MMARHNEKTSAGRAKMLSGGNTRDRLAEVDEVLVWCGKIPMKFIKQLAKISAY